MRVDDNQSVLAGRSRSAYPPEALTYVSESIGSRNICPLPEYVGLDIPREDGRRLGVRLGCC